MADNDMQIHENAQHPHLPDRRAAGGDSLPAVAPATFLPLIEKAKTQADYAAAYAEFNAWYQPQLKALTWAAPISAAATHLGMWLRSTAENGVTEQNVAGVKDGLRLFKRAQELDASR